MKQKLIIAVVCGVALVALAGPIKTWNAGEVVTASDINANFQHIHNLMVGGHGARLVNADVSASAGISHSKLATPALVPKAMGGIVTPCDGGTCAWNVNSGFSSTFTRGAQGQYTVSFSSARPNANYVPIVTPIGDGINSVSNMVCGAAPTFTTSGFSVRCGLTFSRALTDAGSVTPDTDLPFSVVVFDNDN